jgi:FlaA1/EpsC-like NDP-sugar epimerase
VLLLFIGGSRIFIRSVLYRPRSKGKVRVVIYGAGASGRQLAQALLNGNVYYLETFFDDDKQLTGSSILSIKILDGFEINTALPQLNVSRIFWLCQVQTNKKLVKF